ncbi:adenylate/guanylate cyclase domain-containing protein [Oceanibacterium hippocampi]|uniref:Adenylate cyclase 1 n=1 Tax=Oceanibacterium hippocampi TaxID=745714 RepID=A0A1Y5RKA6_9PROT|nr:adenylate/guanylate cyclase domain-containing protein [Oceanibacterium hippocampi]SLN18365.1 Adenylate cyclase 1 [Oceanibacterium hippocampi]
MALIEKLNASVRRMRAGRVRLVSGLVLMVFLAGHLINHSLGLISYQSMEIGREVFLAVWRNGLGTTVLILALVLHGGLAIAAQLRRHSFRRIAPGEMIQIVLGMAILPLAALHVVGTRGLHEVFGVNDTYAYVLLSIWRFSPWDGLQQAILVIVAWLHGCLGMHYWLRLKPGYGDWLPYLYATALLLPVLALLGFVSGAREVNALFEDQAWRDAAFATFNLSEGAAPWAYALVGKIYVGLAVALVVIGGGRAAWLLLHGRQQRVTITYPDGQRTVVSPGTSILEASRNAGIPHASVCGGRGRCSTCRVRVMAGLDDLDPPSEAEQLVLARVGMPEGVRLACQTRPLKNISVLPMLPARVQPREGYKRPAYLQGTEREIAILFADLRSFTKFSQSKLPYDVVFVVNQYFRYMGQAIEESGGHLDKFIGDGVMALFGLTTTSRRGAQDALRAAQAMAKALTEMNETLAHDLDEPFRIGIGIHIGPAVIGEMGYAKAVSVTAIGDAVNTASRLETLNKEYGSQLVFSEEVAQAAGLPTAGLRTEQVTVRGRDEALTIYVVEDATTMPEIVERKKMKKKILIKPASTPSPT